MSRPALLPLVLVVVLGAFVSAGQLETPSTYTVTGTITAAASGDALRHARVFATAAGGNVPATLSDDRGRYQLAGLAAGRHVLTVVKPGYVRQTVPLDVPVRNDEAIDVSLVKAAVITGTLSDELGEPVTLTSVVVRAVKGDAASGAIAAVAQTDDLGQFRATGLAAGSYFVEA